MKVSMSIKITEKISETRKKTTGVSDSFDIEDLKDGDHSKKEFLKIVAAFIKEMQNRGIDFKSKYVDFEEFF